MIQNKTDSLAKTSCGCRISSENTNLWPVLKPIEGRKILCMKLKFKALSHAFRKEEEGTVLCDIAEARFTRNMCACILYFYDEICGIPENVPRFLKNALHIPEERHLGLASLSMPSDRSTY